MLFIGAIEGQLLHFVIDFETRSKMRTHDQVGCYTDLNDSKHRTTRGGTYSWTLNGLLCRRGNKNLSMYAVCPIKLRSN